MGQLSGIVLSNHTCLYKTEAQGDLTHSEEERGRIGVIQTEAQERQLPPKAVRVRKDSPRETLTGGAWPC